MDAYEERVCRENLDQWFFSLGRARSGCTPRTEIRPFLLQIRFRRLRRGDGMSGAKVSLVEKLVQILDSESSLRRRNRPGNALTHSSSTFPWWWSACSSVTFHPET